MRILYTVSTGPADPTKASLPFHLAMNGSHEVGDQPELLLAGDATGLLADGVVDSVEGVGVPPLRELIAKVRQHEIPVYV